VECDLNALRILATDACPGTAGELREVVHAGCKSLQGVDPEDLWAVGESLGYNVQVRWSNEDVASTFDVVLHAQVRHAEDDKVNPLLDYEGGRDSPKTWNLYGNNPLRSRMTRDLTAELRDHLRGSLPDYMMPSAFVFIKELPLTPNGKRDRRALPQPDADAAVSTGPIPEAGTEEKIAEIWQEILGITRIGREDNFFDLGGDSLRLILVRSGLRRAFKKEIPLLDLFKFPTVRMLAQQFTASTEVSSPAKIRDETSARKRAIQRQGRLRQHLLKRSGINSDEHTIRN